MGANSKIEWTHHTFNPWWGCARISPGCDFCYAARDAARFLPRSPLWGTHAERRTFGEKHWNEPLKWDRAAAKAGERHRVFCASMADVFDKNAPEGARDRLWDLIHITSNLDWLLLTKRIGNVDRMLPADWNDDPLLPGYSNVWLGISVVNQEEADRDIPKLLQIPATVRFLSCEPLLGPIDLDTYQSTGCPRGWLDEEPGIDWVIVGGESGTHARPMHPGWARSLRDQCTAAGVPFLFKQWGEFRPWDGGAGSKPIYAVGLNGEAFQGMHRERSDDAHMECVGKRYAGRTLDGRLWDEFPGWASA